jgi:serine/threonine-protein kinase SRPK3
LTDLKASNVLFHLAGGVQNWTSENIYETLGEPDTEALDRLDEHAMEVPIEVVMPIDASKFIDAGLVDWERVVITDFGQSYMIEGRPTNYTPATAVNYRAPETIFENQFTTATDVWSLGCLFFQIRAGFPLFDPWCSTTASILCEIVYLLGKLPEPWWSSFTDRSEYFDDNGNPKLQGGRKNIRAQLYSIGTEDFPPHPGKQDGPMFEPLGTRLSEEEVDLMDDLLGKMLKLRPEERITMDEVVRHPWFLHHDRVIQAKHNPEKLVTQAEIVRPSWLSFQTHFESGLQCSALRKSKAESSRSDGRWR